MKFKCLLSLENAAATLVHNGAAITSEQTQNGICFSKKKWIAFRGGTTGVPIDKLPSISYCKFLFSSVYKVCQSLTVLAEITHARCLPQADFFWIASSKKCLSYFQEQNYGKILCFVHVKNISTALLKSSRIFMLAIWHTVIFFVRALHL